MIKACLGVFVMAIVTYIIRALPVTIFRKEIESKFIKSFLYYVPYAVLGALTFPAIFYSTGNFYTALVGTIVALILAYFEQSLVVVAIGAIVAVFITGLLPVF